MHRIVFIQWDPICTGESVTDTESGQHSNHPKAMGTGYSSSTEKLRDYKPSNCTLVKNSKEEDPYREARRFISEDTKRNCCNVGRDNSVQRWHLPPERSKVFLRKATMGESGTTFYYHDDLLGSEEFPGQHAASQ